MEYTLTYREKSGGWTSFYSFIPEMMIGMNNYFYTFKNGNLYRHNTNEVRNLYYGNQAYPSITGVINERPYETKTFKTFVVDSTTPWNVSIETDLDSGYISKDWFSLKEGDYFAYIRRNADKIDLDFRSAQGVGAVDSVNYTVPTAAVFTFLFNAPSHISEGDVLYRDSGGAIPEKLGLVVSKSGKTITVDTTSGAVTAIPTDFIISIRNSIAESYGATGYFLKYVLTSDENTDQELFSIGSNLFKSNP